jgi:hypothetical protein
MWMPHCDFEIVLHEGARAIGEKRHTMNAGPFRSFRSVAMPILVNSRSYMIPPNIYVIGS